MVESTSTKENKISRKTQEVRDNITVGIRVRPPLPREIRDGVSKNCVAVDPASNQIFVSL